MEYSVIEEGKTSLRVPKSELPEHARKFGFYNPAMRGDRDLSVCIVSVFSKMFEMRTGKKPEACDLLCATGARAVRYAKEVGINVTANDSNENALELAKENAKTNNVSIEIINNDANSLLSERSFDIIDIDPFGSPYPFIDSAARAIGDYGLLCITATDTATLSGVYPRVCERRYGIPSFQCDFSKELGTRILLSFVIRELAKYSKSFTPLICYSKRHYIRIFGIIEKGAEKVDALMEKFKYISLSHDSWYLKNFEKGKLLGNIYMGQLKDDAFCKASLEESEKRGFENMRLLSQTLNEIDSAFFYESETISKKLGINISLSDMVFNIARSGHGVSYTSFSESAIKTDSSWEDLEKILKFGKSNS